jgi:serine/threonine-protein kinase RsbT
MADSTTNLDLIQQSQTSKEVTANALYDATSPASLYGRRGSTTTGLSWGYYGGNFKSSPTGRQSVANGVVALTASTTNYVEADTTTGAVSKNTTGFTSTGKIPLYKIVTAASELARNTLVHGGGGHMELETVEGTGRPGLRLTFTDSGPGIPDVSVALSDGYTTGHGLGLGLGGARRLVQDFTIDSAKGEGTTVTVAAWPRGVRQAAR